MQMHLWGYALTLAHFTHLVHCGREGNLLKLVVDLDTWKENLNFTRGICNHGLGQSKTVNLDSFDIISENYISEYLGSVSIFCSDRFSAPWIGHFQAGGVQNWWGVNIGQIFGEPPPVKGFCIFLDVRKTRKSFGNRKSFENRKRFSLFRSLRWVWRGEGRQPRGRKSKLM